MRQEFDAVVREQLVSSSACAGSAQRCRFLGFAALGCFGMLVRL